MATENALFRLPFEAAEDLSDYQYHFVVLDSNGKVQLPDAATDVSIGILQNAPESGKAAEVMLDGISKIVAGGALTVGTLVQAEYVGATDAGKAIATASTGWNRGVITMAAGAEDDLASVWLIDPSLKA